MSNEWDQYAQNWDSDASVQEYAARAFETLSTVIVCEDLSVFDFGCGTGSLTRLLSPVVREVVALDSSTKMIKCLAEKKLSNVTPLAQPLTPQLIASHPAWISKFDLIVASSVCSFLPDYESTLGLLKSLMKPGAIFVQWDWLQDDMAATTGLSERRVMNALQQNKLSIFSGVSHLIGSVVKAPRRC